ncbi:hypothetical protein AMTRI_Chr02g212400 [Amborella trichopoda]
MEAPPPPKQHFLLFPWLAFGHIIPFFQLAKRLADAGISVTFLTLPSVFSHLPPLHVPHHLSLISFHPVSLPSIPELPEAAATTSDLPPPLQDHLKAAFDALQPLFHTLLPKLSPNLVIHDFTSYWLPEIATTFGIPTVFFSIFNAASFAYAAVPYRVSGTPTDLTSAPPDFPPSAVYFHPFEAKQLQSLSTFQKTDVSSFERFTRTICNSHMVIIRSCYELEKKYIDYLVKEYLNYFKECGGSGVKKFLPIGFLPPRPGDEAHRDNGTMDSGSCQKFVKKPWAKWLDKQPVSSVTYVAFGTECLLNQSQTNAVAIGLEQSGFRFLWVGRAPVSGKLPLPDGFLERVQGRGLIVEEWVPQAQILSHPSIGVFFSHSGTSSVIEGLTTGKRLVLLPMMLDQGLIARLVADEWRAALEIERANLQDGSFTAESVCRAVQRAVSEEDDSETWRNAKDLQARIFCDTELEMHYLSKFVNCATKLVCPKS